MKMFVKEFEQLGIPLTVPSLKALSFFLRHQELWPEGFGTWNFNKCKTCAIGLSYELWCNAGFLSAHFNTVEKTFNISGNTAMDIFGGGVCSRMKLKHDQITPEMIADLIDEHLAKPHA